MIDVKKKTNVIVEKKNSKKINKKTLINEPNIILNDKNVIDFFLRIQ